MPSKKEKDRKRRMKSIPATVFLSFYFNRSKYTWTSHPAKSSWMFLPANFINNIKSFSVLNFISIFALLIRRTLPCVRNKLNRTIS